MLIFFLVDLIMSSVLITHLASMLIKAEEMIAIGVLLET